jgi:hypothetical protein
MLEDSWKFGSYLTLRVSDLTLMAVHIGQAIELSRKLLADKAESDNNRGVALC